jgi:hypothetical protein
MLTRSGTPFLCLALLALLCSSCVGTRKLIDPTLRIHTRGGDELGVSTDYGVIFLGRTATAGYIEVEAMFGDGPSVESTVIEPLGGGLYTAETEIRLPSVPLKFDNPLPGTTLLIAGRTASGPWEATVDVVSDPRVYGILLEIPLELQGRANQVGAGVYWVSPYDEHEKRLVGLVTGRVTLSGPDGEHEFLSVAGPEDLWRLVTHRRDLLQRKTWVYREDIM